MYMEITENNFITIQIHKKICNLQVPLLILYFSLKINYIIFIILNPRPLDDICPK